MLEHTLKWMCEREREGWKNRNLKKEDKNKQQREREEGKGMAGGGRRKGVHEPEVSKGYMARNEFNFSFL